MSVLSLLQELSVPRGAPLTSTAVLQGTNRDKEKGN